MLNAFLGITGVQVAQAVADVITFFICIPFTIHLFRSLPADGEDTHE